MLNLEEVKDAASVRKTIVNVEVHNDIVILTYKANRAPAAVSLANRLEKCGFNVARKGRIVAVKVPEDREPMLLDVLRTKNFKSANLEEVKKELISKLS